MIIPVINKTCFAELRKVKFLRNVKTDCGYFQIYMSSDGPYALRGLKQGGGVVENCEDIIEYFAGTLLLRPLWR